MTGPRVCVPDGDVWFIDNAGLVTPSCPLLAVTLTLNNSWSPYGQGSVELALDEALAARIDPTGTGPALATVTLLRNYTSPTGSGSVDPQQQSFTLSVRGVVKNYSRRVMTVDLATFDQTTQTKMTPTDVAFPAGTAVSYIVTQVSGNGLATGSPPLAATVPEEVVWEVGVTGTAFLQGVLGPTGRKILCDEQGRDWLADEQTPITPTSPPAPRLYDLSDVIELETRGDLDAGLFADGVVAEYEWLDSAGVTQRRRDVAAPTGVVNPVWTLERPDGRYPGPGAASRIRGRLSQWRHERTLRMLWDLEVRPGVIFGLIDEAGTITEGRVSSVTWREDGTMDVTAAYAERRIARGTTTLSFGGAASVTQAVTFPEPFDTVPTVVASYAATATSPKPIVGAANPTTTGFTLVMMTADGATHTGSRAVSWIAVGGA